MGWPGTAQRQRHALGELLGERAKSASFAGGTATHSAVDRPNIAYSFCKANRDMTKPRVRTEARLKRIARYLLGEPELMRTVRLETYSTSASGICRRRRVGRVRHAHQKELWLQDQVAAKNVELGRVPTEDNEAYLGMIYLERDRMKKCVTKMEMLFCTGLGLENSSLWFRALKYALGRTCSVFVLHLPTGNVHATQEPATEKQWNCNSPRAIQDNSLDHLKERFGGREGTDTPTDTPTKALIVWEVRGGGKKRACLEGLEGSGRERGGETIKGFLRKIVISRVWHRQTHMNRLGG